MFKIYDYKTKTFSLLESEDLKKYIINKTNSTFENKDVIPERTGQRPSYLASILSNLTNGYLIKGLFLVTALERVNPDKETRYLLIATGNLESYEQLLPYINDYIPFIHIDCSDYTPVHEGGYLSSWFRSNMGRAFSFIDIDYLIIKNKIYLIEEKTYNGTLGYGQKMSYSELMKDIFNIPTILCIVYCTEDECHLKISDDSVTYKEGTTKIETFFNWLNK